MRFDTLSEWLSWQEQLHSAQIELGLGRVRAVAERMQLLTPRASVISVAGTNGKGSCVATLEALHLSAGVSVGAFTSPHFLRYNERIRLNGYEVDDQALCASFDRIDRARKEISLTYFEFGTLAALDLMQQADVDVMLLEVGLGGRLDAVNIIDADVAIVTSIALDHQDWLGSNLEVIGFEKAGVFRPHKWAICADQQAPRSVTDYAHDIGAYWISMGGSMTVESSPDSWCWSGINATGESVSFAELPIPNLPMPSVAAALQAFALLGGAWPEDLPAVLSELSLTGRSQTFLWQGAQLLLDVAHNPAAAEMLAERIRAICPKGRVHSVVAVMADKDRQGIFQPLVSQVHQWYVSGIPYVSRASSASLLADNLKTLGVDAASISQFAKVEDAVSTAVANSQAGDTVLVMGSFYTVAAVLELTGQKTH